MRYTKLTLIGWQNILERCTTMRATLENPNKLKKEIIELAMRACEEYFKSPDINSKYSFTLWKEYYLLKHSEGRRSQVEEMYAFLSKKNITLDQKVCKVIEKFCKLKGSYSSKNSYFLEQLTIHPINYLLQVVSCRYIYDERINENYSFIEILKQLGFPNELCLHFTALEKGQLHKLDPEYVCGLPIVNVNNEGDVSMKKSLRTPKNGMSIDDLKRNLKYDKLSSDDQKKVDNLIIAYKDFVSEPTKEEKAQRIEDDKQLLCPSEHTPQSRI